MPIMLTRKDGPPTPFRNAEYIPFYYFIPKSILSCCGAELNAIPRNPQELFRNRAACEFVESDLFRLLIIDAAAFMVWPYMGFGEYMEIYSDYDPAWRFAHCPDYWIQELTDEGILASVGELFKGCHSELGYVPEWQIDIYLRYIVPNVMKKHRMDEIIQVAREYPWFEDFDFRKSNQKTDFIRQWYHTRTKHPMISLEEFQEAYADAHGGQEYNEEDAEMKTIHNTKIIGIDHGYGNMKTTNCCFPTGITAYDHEPLFTADMLVYGGRYYLIGEGHKEFAPDKINDEDYYVLTLAAIAKELKAENLTEAHIVIAAGLPLTWTSGQKADFKAI